MAAVVLGFMWLGKLQRQRECGKELPAIIEEVCEARLRCIAAYQHYVDFKPLPEDKAWMASHDLIQTTSRGRCMLSSKGVFVFRKLGFVEF